MTARKKTITAERLILYMVMYKILSPEEAETALKTGLLPDDIMVRLNLVDKAIKN
jgi:hypothetical protein